MSGSVSHDALRSFATVPRGHCCYVEETTPRRVSIYDAGAGEFITHLPDFPAAVEFVSLARDRDRVAVRTADGKHSVWSYRPVELLKTTSDVSKIEPGNMQLSNRGDRLAVFNPTQVWELNVETGAVRSTKHPGSNEEATGDSYFFVDATHFVYEASTHGTMLVNLASETYRILNTEKRSPKLCFNADGSRLIAWGDNIRVFDTVSVELLLEFPAPLEPSFREHFWISADDSMLSMSSYEQEGATLLSCSRFMRQFIVGLPDGQVQRNNDRENALLNLALSPTGNRYATLHTDEVTRIWDAHKGRTLFEHRMADQAKFDLVLLGAGAEAISSGADRAIHHWNVESGEMIWSSPAHETSCRFLEADPAESRLAAIFDDGTLAMLRLDDGLRVHVAPRL